MNDVQTVEIMVNILKIQNKKAYIHPQRDEYMLAYPWFHPNSYLCSCISSSLIQITPVHVASFLAQLIGSKYFSSNQETFSR